MVGAGRHVVLYKMQYFTLNAFAESGMPNFTSATGGSHHAPRGRSPCFSLPQSFVPFKNTRARVCFALAYCALCTSIYTNFVSAGHRGYMVCCRFFFVCVHVVFVPAFVTLHDFRRRLLRLKCPDARRAPYDNSAKCGEEEKLSRLCF